MKNKKYITTNKNGLDFRTIAETMSEMGYQMNHATSRNVFLFGLQELINHLSKDLDIPITKTHIEKMLKSQHVHEYLSDVLYKANEELKKEKEI